MARPFAEMFVEFCGANTLKLSISSHRILHLVLLHVHPAPLPPHTNQNTYGEMGVGWHGGGRGVGAGGGGGGGRAGRVRSVVLRILPEEAGDLCVERHLGVSFPRGGHDPTRGRGIRKRWSEKLSAMQQT